jgi:hypothetical protein
VSVTPSESVTPSVSVTPQATVSVTPPGTPPNTPPVTPSVTPPGTPPGTPPVTPSVTPPATPEPTSYFISWAFQQSAQSGECSISVNGVQVVYATSTNSGTLTIAIGDYVSVSVGAGASSFLIAQADLLIYDGASEIYNVTPTANGTIDASAYEF